MFNIINQEKEGAKKVKVQKPSIFLQKPDKTTIAKLSDTRDESLIIKFNEGAHEFSFSVPYMIEINHEQVKNPHIDLIKEKYLIKLEFNGSVKHFTITSINKNGNEGNEMQVECFSSEHVLSYHLLNSYESTGNLKMVSDDILRRTGWKTGYINPKFNLMYRNFEVDSQRVLSFMDELRETFECFIIFDTENDTVNYYEEDEVSKYKGLNIGLGKYVKTLSEVININDVVTRLYVYGDDGLTINSVNPSGQSYIDDFSFFLYPFDMDESGKVVSHSEYMSDSLAKSLVKYNQFTSGKKDEFYNLLEDKKDEQKKQTEESNKLVQLESELQIILDSITLAKTIGEPTASLITKRNEKNKEIKSVKEKIKVLESNINNIDEKIEKLGDSLNMETHLNSEQMKELYKFIQEDEWTDENQFDENDLYEAGMKELKEINEPPIEINTSVVNFLKMAGESHNWERIGIGDIIKIKHSILGIDVKTTISEIQYGFDNEEINLSVTNSKRANSPQQKIENALYTIGKVNTEHNKRKINWNKVAYNFNLRNDRIEETPVNPNSPTINHKDHDDGSVNLVLKWGYPEYSKTKKNEHNIDGFLVYMYADTDEERYQFGSKMADETMVDVIYSSRSYTFPSVPSNLHYTIGVQAYRRVDDDIHPDTVIKSEIVRFTTPQSKFRSVSMVNEGEDDELSDPYQPSDFVNFRGLVNGMKIMGGKTPPSKPIINQLWFDEMDNKWYRWDGEDWTSDFEFEEIKSQLSEFEKEINKTMEHVNEELDRANVEREEAMRELEEQMKHLEEEVVPEVERAVKETEIPMSVDPPGEVPESGLWWDTSSGTPVMKRWDEDEADWVKLAPTENDIEDMMNDMREEAEGESKRYSKVEILRARKDIINQLHDEIGDISGSIQDLLDIKDELIETAENIDKILDEYDGKFSEFEHTIDEVEGSVKTVITDMERVDGVAQANKTQIEVNSKAIEAKLESTEYEKDKEGIINSIEQNTTDIELNSKGLELTVSKEEFEEGMANISTANLITSLSSAWEQGGYNTDGEKIDNDSKFKVRTEIGSTVLTPDTDYTFYSEDLQLANELSYTVKISVIHLHYSSLTDYEMTRIVDKEILEKPITFNSGAPSYKNISEIDLEGSAVVFIIEMDKLGIKHDDLDRYQLMLNKGVTAQSYQPHSPDIIERISSTEATIKVHADSIEQKAEKSELLNFVDKQEYTEKIGSLTTSIDGITGTVQDISADVDKHTGEIKSASSKIGELEVTAENITTTVSDLNADVTSANSAISKIEQRADNIEITVSDVKTDLDGLEIGGRNLSRDSNNFNPSVMNTYDGSDLTSYEENYEVIEWGATDAHKMKFTGGKMTTVLKGYKTITTTTNTVEGETYTISFYVKNLRDVPMSVHVNGILPRPIVELEANEAKRVVVNGKRSTAGLQLQFRASVAGRYIEFAVWRAQVEKGTKATDWGLAEEDRVNKTNVLSSINLSTEGIQIQASKVDIKGLVSFINNDGTTGTMINGGRIVSKSITANELNVNSIFGNSAVIAKIQSDSVKTANLNADKITAGTVKSARIATSAITAGKIATNAVTAIKINANAITADKIATNAVTAGKINVTNLAAIKANLGTVTAGKIKGVTIEGVTGTFGSVKVTNGDFLLVDDVSGIDYSATPKTNLVSDPSFEFIREVSGGSPGLDTLFTESSWSKKSGNPRITGFTGGGGQITLRPIFGDVSLLLNGSTTISQDLNIKLLAKNKYTFSIYMRPYTNGQTANLEFEIKFYSSSGASLSSVKKSFSTSKNEASRVSHTFTVPNNTIYSSLYIKSTNNNWKMIDGVQIVEGSRPTIYTAEDALHDLKNGLTVARYLSSLLMKTNAIDVHTGTHLYLRPSSTGDVRVTKQGTTGDYVDLRAAGFHAASVNHRGGGSHLYLRSSGETRSTKLGSTTAYIPHRASSHPTSSSANYKSNRKRYETSIIDTMMDLNPSTYHINTDLEGRVYDKIKLGFFSEEVPQLFKDEDGVDPYSLTTGVIKMSQEQQKEIERLKGDYQILEMVVDLQQAELQGLKKELQSLKR